MEFLSGGLFEELTTTAFWETRGWIPPFISFSIHGSISQNRVSDQFMLLNKQTASTNMKQNLVASAFSKQVYHMIFIQVSTGMLFNFITTILSSQQVCDID